MYLCAVHTCTKQKKTWSKLLCTYNLLMIFMLLSGLFQWTSENTKTDIQINHWKKRMKSKLFAFPYLTKWNQNVYFCCHSIFNFLWIQLPPTLAHSHYIKTSTNTKMINHFFTQVHVISLPQIIHFQSCWECSWQPPFLCGWLGTKLISFLQSELAI